MSDLSGSDMMMINVMERQLNAMKWQLIVAIIAVAVSIAGICVTAIMPYI